MLVPGERQFALARHLLWIVRANLKFLKYGSRRFDDGGITTQNIKVAVLNILCQRMPR